MGPMCWRALPGCIHFCARRASWGSGPSASFVLSFSASRAAASKPCRIFSGTAAACAAVGGGGERPGLEVPLPPTMHLG
eukprot:12456377-Heterocapsa_arctica.AAC.1